MMHKKDLDAIAMYKAAASGPDGNCVGWALLRDGAIAVFNTDDDQDGAALRFTPAEWNAFLDGVRTDRFLAL
ncbi:DUF397 domain-containing protein [Nocardia sp. NPDC052566]|uniref:DUF397 domain-containing protein n=1 Tax=Nocardia sp. NPDC052566 TaxID=3364330 RepID=UPI0037CA65C3